MIALHEAFPAVVAEISSFATQRLRDQKAGRARQRERSGMELVKLHVGEFGTGIESQCEPISRGNVGIRSVAIHLARAARCNED